MFEDAVLAGAAEHGDHNLTFLWADLNEAMVVVHTEDVRIVNGALLMHLYHLQPWRNAMQLYLHGPTPKDRVKILLSHQPSRSKHNLSMQCKEGLIKKLVQHGNDMESWKRETDATEDIETPRFAISIPVIMW